LERRDRIIEKLIEIYSSVLKRDVSKEVFTEGRSIVDELFIDSLTGLQIIVKIEQVFQVIIEDDDEAIKMIDSITESVDFILRNTKNQEYL